MVAIIFSPTVNLSRGNGRLGMREPKLFDTKLSVEFVYMNQIKSFSSILYLLPVFGVYKVFFSHKSKSLEVQTFITHKKTFVGYLENQDYFSFR